MSSRRWDDSSFISCFIVVLAYIAGTFDFEAIVRFLIGYAAINIGNQSKKFVLNGFSE